MTRTVAGVMLLVASSARAATVTLRFLQNGGCAGVAHWELVAAPITADTPDPTIADGAVVAVIMPSSVTGTCGVTELEATLDVAEPPGDTRWWVRAVAPSGVSAASGGVDAPLPGGSGQIASVMVGGGGSATTDCLLMLQAPANSPPSRPREVRCTDGDPSCDADGVANGECNVPVAACANATAAPERCQSPGVESVTVADAADGRSRRFDPAFALLQARITQDIAPPTVRSDACTTPVTFRVALRWNASGTSCGRARQTLRVTTTSMSEAGVRFRDRDRLKITCSPPPTGCDPAFFPGVP